MSGIGGFFGWNEPPPAAMMTTFASSAVPASVRIRKFGAFGCSQNLQRFHHLAEVKGWMERLDLQHEVVDQPLRGHHREAGNVVDRLLRIEFGALAADLGQNVDQMRLDVEQSELEDREQPRRPGADDRDVGGNSLAHFGHPCLAGVVTTRPSSAGVTLI